MVTRARLKLATTLLAIGCGLPESAAAPIDPSEIIKTDIVLAALDYRGRLATLITPDYIPPGGSFSFVVSTVGDRCRKPSFSGNDGTFSERADTAIHEVIYADSVITFRGGISACGDTTTYLRGGPTWRPVGNRYRYFKTVIRGVRSADGSPLSIERTIPVLTEVSPPR